MASYLRDRFDQPGGQVELAALPVARQVLRTLLDRAVAFDDAGACDAYEGRKVRFQAAVDKMAAAANAP
jgi:hypothetical protein